MTPELQDKLKEKYPEQFKNLSWIECDDGWHDLLDNLFRVVDNHLDHKKRINEPIESFGWSQIKEKFGGLRAYYHGGDEFIRGVIWMAESMSYNICEFTGEKGKLRKQRLDENGQVIPAWMKTMCDGEAEKEGYI